MTCGYSKRKRRIEYLSKQHTKFMLIALDEMIKCNFKGKLLAESMDDIAVYRNQMKKLAKQNEVRSRIILEKRMIEEACNNKPHESQFGTLTQENLDYFKSLKNKGNSKELESLKG